MTEELKIKLLEEENESLKAMVKFYEQYVKNMEILHKIEMSQQKWFIEHGMEYR